MNEENTKRIWNALYHEYNQDLSQIEFLFVGERGDKTIKAVTCIPISPRPQDIEHLVRWINKHVIPEYNRT